LTSDNIFLPKSGKDSSVKRGKNSSVLTGIIGPAFFRSRVLEGGEKKNKETNGT
jgi:hypothetical protein